MREILSIILGFGTVVLFSQGSPKTNLGTSTTLMSNPGGLAEKLFETTFLR